VTTAAEIQLQETEADRVVRWRAQELERAGFGAAAAAELAERNDVDLHRAIELLQSGCPVELALEILR
jgi:hypothetical protein